MRIVYPNVEHLEIDATKTVHYEHLLRCARITHAAVENTEANFQLLKLLYNKQHYSVFRHVPHYYILNKMSPRLPGNPTPPGGPRSPFNPTEPWSEKETVISRHTSVPS